jgi:uncharacterized membrane protein YccC
VLDSLIAFKPRDVPVRVAVRNAVGVVAPLVVGVLAGHVPAGLAIATGALNTMFTDQPGPYRLRMERMLAAACAAGASALLGIVIGGHALLVIPVVVAIAFGAAMMVAIGPMAARVGLTSLIVMLVTADMRLPPANAPGIALLILSGGLLQMLLAVAAWPWQRYRPERFALADFLQQLAQTARTRPDAMQRPPASQTALEALVMLHGEHRARGAAMQSFRIMAALCERVRIDLLSLSDLHARLVAPSSRRLLEAILDPAGRCLDVLAVAVRDARPEAALDAPIGVVESGIEALDASIDGTNGDAQVRMLRIAQARAESLAGQLRALLRNARLASGRGDVDAALAEASLPPSLRPGSPLPLLRANLAVSSIAFRHAVRCALCVGLAAGCERALRIPHGVWIPMTAAIVLKPDFGGTLRFGVLRTAGTFAGLLLTTLLAHYAMQTEGLRLVLMGALCVGFRLLATVNYGVGVALLTGMLVLLLSFQGMSPADAIHARLIATLLGSGLALGAYALWPTWEAGRIRPTLARLVDAYRLHMLAVLGGRMDDLVETRAAARRARTNAQASLERLRGEPRRAGSAGERRMAEAVLANASRLIRATVMLEALERERAPLPQAGLLARFANPVDRILVATVAALRGDRFAPLPVARPDERELHAALVPLIDAGDATAIAIADACDRIADSVDTLTHLLQPSGQPEAGHAIAG